MSAKKSTRRLAVIAGALGCLVLVACAGLIWQWVVGIQVDAVRIDGARFTAEDAIRTQAGIDSTRMLIDVNPDTVAAALATLPWIREASVRRWPTGRVDIRVTERTPVMMVLGADGRPAYYVDAMGKAMPMRPDAVFDVPVVRGDVPAFHGELELDEPLRGFAESQERLPREVTSLIAEVELQDGEVWIRTLPTQNGETIRVRLGKDDFTARLHRLHAFWHQAVAGQPHLQFAQIDLRYNSQIVTRQTERK